MVTAGANLGAVSHRIPRRISPFDRCGVAIMGAVTLAIPSHKRDAKWARRQFRFILGAARLECRS
jgi:hypothetical protein